VVASLNPPFWEGVRVICSSIRRKPLGLSVPYSNSRWVGSEEEEEEGEVMAALLS